MLAIEFVHILFFFFLNYRWKKNNEKKCTKNALINYEITIIHLFNDNFFGLRGENEKHERYYPNISVQTDFAFVKDMEIIIFPHRKIPTNSENKARIRNFAHRMKIYFDLKKAEKFH